MTKKIDVVSIDTGIPIPDTQPSWPIRELKVGESFVFPIDKRNVIQSSASRIKRETGQEYSVRKMDDKNGRIWRTK